MTMRAEFINPFLADVFEIVLSSLCAFERKWIHAAEIFEVFVCD